MVDAYEIGIELALQDGVSAGLEAVAKELAALDAAVAASSAGLMALVRTAGLAAEAVAAVGGLRVRAPAAQPETTPAAASAVVPAEGERRRVAISDEVPGGRAVTAAPGATVVAAEGAAPVTVDRQQAMDVAGPAPAFPVAGGDPVRTGEPGPVPEIRREVERAPVVAPVAVTVRPDGAGPAGTGRPEGNGTLQDKEATVVSVRAAAPEGDGRRVAARVAAAAPDEAAASRAERPVVAPVLVERARAAPVRAEIVRALPQRPAMRDAGAQAPVRIRQDAAERAEDAAAAAPVPGGQAERARPGSGMTGGDRAVAPMRMAAGPGGGGGTVLLDGRLVGEWLMDAMARDAGRPGAGTTGFDPRQAPAWTPSGIL